MMTSRDGRTRRNMLKQADSSTARPNKPGTFTARVPQGARTDIRSIELMSQPDAAQALKGGIVSTLVGIRENPKFLPDVQKLGFLHVLPNTSEIVPKSRNAFSLHARGDYFSLSAKWIQMYPNGLSTRPQIQKFFEFR